ncbi:MAG: hypothetical protein K9J79_07380 [Desulfobacteraceae bacterium]|nr:hypothetical protein [Desulfobacteraceae bacterium]
MRKLVLNGIIAALIAAGLIWLYMHEEAAKPGVLSSAHEFIVDCETCHVPYQGATNENCLECHYFETPAALEPWLRFHEVEKKCLECHTEHLGYGADISEVDHTLFNPDLLCTDCHYDAHEGKFGEDCRVCHDIDTWRIEGFRHPPAEEKNCHRCHQAPESHQEEDFWNEIIKEHEVIVDREAPPSVKECGRCHSIHRWGHLMMEHDLS